MANLFNPSDAQIIIDRIERLKPDSAARWGKMSVSQMLAHIQQPIRVSTGELKLKQSFVGMLFGRIAKKKMLAQESFNRGLPTAPQFVIKHNPDFEEERNRTIAMIKDFSTRGEQGLTKDAHPFFGRMNNEEWIRLNWMHLDHHLKQFGV
jgi:hypothetical protein